MAGALTGRPVTERANVVQQQVLNIGGLYSFAQQLPMGETWYALYLRFAATVVIGTGAGPVTEGELLAIKNVLLRTDRGELICNLPGRALYKIATYKMCSPPRKDAIAAASATYRVTLPIYFVDRYAQMLRPNDTALNTSRYNSCTLQITYGTLADLFTAPGTATLATTLDIEIERSHGALDPKVKQIAYISYDYDPPVDASVQQVVNLERGADMSIKRLYVHSSTAGLAGVPWSGVNADTIQNVVSVKDQTGLIEKERFHAQIQDVNKLDAFLESIISGVEVIDFMRDGSITAAMATGGKSLLQYVWTNQGGVGALSIVTVTREMIRALK